MKSKIVEVPIASVLPNPHRDFENYPIDDVQVDRLVASFEDTGGIWHGIPARPGKDKGTYELAFGHHRLEAAKRLDYQTIRLELAEHDDDEMIRMLAVENGTQRVNNAAASLDTVAAITRRLAYFLLRFKDLDDLGRILPRSDTEHLFESQKAFEVARGTLLKGDGIGKEIIIRYAPKGTLQLDEVRGSIASLKATGKYAEIVHDVTQHVNEELEEEEADRQRELERQRQRELEAERKAQEKADREAEKERQRAEKERKRQEELARKQAEAEQRQKEAEERKEREAIEKADREAEEAKRKAEEHAKRMRLAEEKREERERKAKEEAERKERERKEREAKLTKEQEAREKREKELRELEVRSARAEPSLDNHVIPYFRNHYTLKRFRDFVTRTDTKHFFPVEMQLDFVKEMCARFEKENRKPAAENMTATFVGNHMNAYVSTLLRGEQEDERRQRSLDEQITAELETMRKGASWVSSGAEKVIRLVEQGAHLPPRFERVLKDLEEDFAWLQTLREKTGYRKGAKEVKGSASVAPERTALPKS